MHVDCTLDTAGTVSGRFIGKENRFRCVVEINGRRRKCSIPGTMRGRELFVKGVQARVGPSSDPNRKTWGTLLMLEHRGIWVSVDSGAPNRLLGKAIEMGAVPELPRHEELVREPGYGNHRLDFLLRDGDRNTYIEVKSVTLAENGMARFPGAPTIRGTKHLGLLSSLAKKGHGAYVFFIVQREDVREWSPNYNTDPEFSSALLRAMASGVQVVARRTKVTPKGMDLLERIPVLGRMDEKGNSGGYQLVIEVRGDGPHRTFGPGSPRLLEGKTLPEGFYIYSGNAERNLLQRAARHLDRKKKRRWHIDYLLGLKAAKVIDVVLNWDGPRVECSEHAKTMNLEGAEIPIRGFGSSDCDLCDSHLAYFRHLPHVYLRRLPSLDGEFL